MSALSFDPRAFLRMQTAAGAPAKAANPANRDPAPTPTSAPISKLAALAGGHVRNCGSGDTPPWHPSDADDTAEREAIAADAATLLPDPDTPERQRLDHDHAVAVAGLVEAARKRPPSWADPASLPGTGTLCACCQGTRWWGDARGWRCATCHPRANGYRPDGDLREVRS